MSDKNEYAILSEMQSEIAIPKDRWNDYGKFHYRSYEDIVEAVKKACARHNATLFIEDAPIEVGGWHYVQANVTLHFNDIDKALHSKAVAREQESKSGMDASQITGTASTYARKYALCGLFSIDGQDDADAMDNAPQKPSKRATKPSKKYPKSEFWELLQESAKKLGLDPMKGVENMKGWTDFADSDSFYTVMVGCMRNDEMGTMARMFPEIQEVR